MSLVVSGANRHDVKLLEPTLDHCLAKRARGKKAPKQNLCADKGYRGKKAAKAIAERGYVPHVRQIGEEGHRKTHGKNYRPRRWVVERTHSWLNRYRKILVRFEKKAASYEALLELACASIVYRRLISIYG